jgi:predicted DNA-binding transcriptional regulator YafY
MARAAEEALIKIETMLPPQDRARVADAKIFAPPMEMTERLRGLIDFTEPAIEAREVLFLAYRDEQGEETSRCIHPLGLWFWGKVWTLIAWCELRNDFRMFRLDRVGELKLAKRRYKPAPERSLAECLRQVEAKYGPQR